MWRRYRALPGWAQILLAILALGLLPWELIALGSTAIGVGVWGLLRGPVGWARITSRSQSWAAVTTGVVMLLAGSGLAVEVVSSEAPPSTAPAVAPTAVTPTPAPSTTAAPATVPATTRPAPSTTVKRTVAAPPTSKRPPRTTAAPAPRLTVAIVRLPATGQGNRVTAAARTLPRASCDILVEYASGPSTARGLDPKTASGSGSVSWTWLVGTRTTPGSWPVTVTCSKGAVSTSAQRNLTVLDTGNPG